MENQLNLFYNTNRTPKSQVLELAENNNAQNKIILNLFQTSFPKWTASLVWEQLIGTNQIDRHTPLTSIRRGLSQLQNAGILEIEKDQKRMGLYGRMECYYKLIKNA